MSKAESESETVSRDSSKSESETDGWDSSKSEPNNDGGNDPKPEPDNKDNNIEELKERLEWHRRVIDSYVVQIDAAYDRICMDTFAHFLENRKDNELWFYLELEKHELLTEWVEELLENVKITMAMIERK